MGRTQTVPRHTLRVKGFRVDVGWVTRIERFSGRRLHRRVDTSRVEVLLTRSGLSAGGCRQRTRAHRSQEDPMLGPTPTTRHMANQAYEERLSHAARIRMVQKERHDDSKPFHRDGYRLITARRLAAGIAGAVLATAVAAGTVANVAASPSHANGGGAALIR